MTVGQILNVCKNHNYIILFTGHREYVAINCKSQFLGSAKIPEDINEQTWITSYRECSFMEYISKKTAFKK